MAKKLRYIKHTTIQIGDTIRVSSKLKDCDVTIVGVVHDRWYTPGRTTVYETKEGVELLLAHPDGTMTRGETHVNRITLINRNPDPTLF